MFVSVERSSPVFASTVTTPVTVALDVDEVPDVPVDVVPDVPVDVVPDVPVGDVPATVKIFARASWAAVSV